MKKLTKTLTVLLLIFVCVFMSACSTFGKVEKALEKIGYTAIESDETAEKMEEESDVAVTVHVFSNKESLTLSEAYKLNVVIVFEFKSTDEMKEYYEDSNTMQGLIKDIEEDGSAKEFYDELVEKGLANGNCLVLCTNIIVAGAVAEAVKGA